MTGRPNDAAHGARHRSEGIWQPPRGDLVRVGSPTRRWFLQAGLTGFAGLSMAATVFRHLRIDLDAQWVTPQGRPIPVMLEGGRPIAELF
jgi:hypothetical protein